MHRPYIVLATLLFSGCEGDTGGSDASGDSDTGGSVTCPTPTAGPTLHDSVIEADEVWRADEGPHDSVIAHGSSHGVVLGYAGATVDFESGFTFEDLGGCQQTLQVLDTCPDPKPACE